HMTGAAVGGMLASQAGHRPVFLLGAALVLVAGLALRLLLWPYRGARAEIGVAVAQDARASAPAHATHLAPPAAGLATAPASPAAVKRATLRRLLGDPGYGALLL